MLFKPSGDERLSLVLRRSYPFLCEEDLKSPFSDIPTFLSTDMEDGNYCDYSKLEDLNTPTPLDDLDHQFDYEYLNLNEIKTEQPSPPLRQARSADEFHNLDLVQDIKSEFMDDPNPDYGYYTHPDSRAYAQTYTTDPLVPHHDYHGSCHFDLNAPNPSDPHEHHLVQQQQQQQQPQTHLQHQQHHNPESQMQYQPNYYQPCYIDPSTTPYYSHTHYTATSTTTTTTTTTNTNKTYHTMMKWDPMYSPDSGVCTASPNTQPSPYAVSSSSYSTRSDNGDLEMDILRLTTCQTQSISSSPLNTTSSMTQPSSTYPAMFGRQVSAPINIRTQDSVQKPATRPRVKIDDSQKPFLCGMNNCPKRFVRIDELKRHQRTHSGVKQFVCEDCQKGFTRSDHLTTHRRTHTGERPYPCSICDRRFARSDEKNRHEKTHSKEKSRAGRKPRQMKSLTGSTTTLARSL